MRNIVLDTNSLIIAISAKNDCHKVWQSFLNGDYTLCISNEIVEEYLEVMSRNINKYVAEAIIYTILTRENVKRLTPHYRFHLILISASKLDSRVTNEYLENFPFLYDSFVA